MEFYFSLSPKGPLAIMMRSRPFCENQHDKNTSLSKSFKGLRGEKGIGRDFLKVCIV